MTDLWDYKPEGLQLELLDFLKANYPSFLLYSPNEEIQNFIVNFRKIITERGGEHKVNTFNISKIFEYRSIIQSFKNHLYRKFPMKDDESEDFYLDRVDLTVKTITKEKKSNPQISGESNESYEERINLIIKNKCEKLREMDYERTHLLIIKKLEELKTIYPEEFREAKIRIEFMPHRGKHVVILDIPKMEVECEFTVDEFLGKKG